MNRKHLAQPKYCNVDWIASTTSRSVKCGRLLKFVTLFITVVFCCHLAAAGMGSMSAFEPQDGYRGSGGSGGGLITFAVALALTFGWLIGRASIFLIYGPTLLGIVIVSAFRWAFFDVTPTTRGFSMETIAACFVIGALASLFMAYKFGLFNAPPSSPKIPDREVLPELKKVVSTRTAQPEPNEFTKPEIESHSQPTPVKPPSKLPALVERPPDAKSTPLIKHVFSPRAHEPQSKPMPIEPAALADKSPSAKAVLVDQPPPTAVKLLVKHGFSPRQHEPHTKPTPAKLPPLVDQPPPHNLAPELGSNNDTKLAAPPFKLVSITYEGQNVAPFMSMMEIQALGAHIYAGLQGHGCEVNSAPQARLRVTGSFDNSVPQEFVLYAQSLFALRQGAWLSYELPAHIANLWHLRFR